MSVIPENMQGSTALQFIMSQGWNWKPTTYPNVELETCPYCKHGGYGHFYIECRGTTDPQARRNGLFMCQRCGKGGNLLSLKQHLGLVDPNFSSQKEWSASEKRVDPLPNVEEAHQALMTDADALDYLINIRGWSREIIVRQKIGIVQKHYFKKTGEVKALVFPYLVNGNAVWVQYRTCPDINDLKRVEKDFTSPHGWEAVLYNGEILKEGLSEVIMVEGAGNCIAAMNRGVENICGVPGANQKRAEWIETLDKLGLEKIYICYDKDKAGQKAAQEIASRIGIEKCWKIILPDFTATSEAGLTRPGKDLNEWFVYGGGTKEKLEELKANATLFDVDGVTNTQGAVDEFLEEIEGRGAGMKYKFPLFAHLIQFDEGDRVDLMAEGKVGKTTVGIQMMEHMVSEYHETAAVICLEMTRAKLARKWVSHKTGIADFLPNTPEETLALTNQFRAAIPALKEEVANREGDLLFCYPKYQSADDIYKLVIDCIRRYGAKWIMLDNLQRLCDTTIGNRNRTQYLSEISKMLSRICKDYNVQMLLIVQPHQIGQGRIISGRDADGASQIAKDCDGLITMHRNPMAEMTKEDVEKAGYIKTNESFKPETLISVSYSRYSAGGQDEFYFDGARSTLLALSEGRIQAMNVMRNTVGYAAQAAARNIPEVAAAATAMAGEDREVSA